MADREALAFALTMSRELTERFKAAEAEGPESTFWRDPARYGVWMGQAAATLEEIVRQGDPEASRG